MIKNQRGIILMCLIVFFVVVAVWAFGWMIVFNPNLMNENELNKAGEIFDSISALFSGLAFFGLLITILLQNSELKLQREELKLTREELQKSSDANVSIANDNNEKAILDLYQSFTTEYFEQIRMASWRVLSNCIKSKDYCEYVVDSFFVSHTSKLSDESVKNLRHTYPEEKFKTNKEVKEQETSDRIKLDLLLNFFNLLANKKDVNEVIKNCDFYYDWYRPLFWWVLYFREEKYYQNEQVRKYSSKPFWLNMLKKLDECYECEKFDSDEMIWEYLINHPIIVKKGIDPKYGFKK